MAVSRSPVLVLALVAAVLAAGCAFAATASERGPAGDVCYALTLSVGSGSGSVEKSPSSSGTCPLGQYYAGYGVTVIATASGGYVFSGWTGADNNSANPTTVTMTSDKTVSGSFSYNCYALALSVGSGSGTVERSPQSAGGCPTGQYPPGYGVTLVATPNPGYTFSNWTGADNNAFNPSTVTMTSNKTVTGNFAQVTCYQLTTSVGSGSGTVEQGPPSAGGCPNGAYPPGYDVTVIATASAGYIFTGWTGADNNNNPTVVTMNSNRSVAGNFASNCYALTTGVASGIGAVERSPGNAGGCPNGSYPAGYGVLLIATPSGGYTFAGWTGADNNNNPTTVTMNGDRTVMGNFTAVNTNTPTNTSTSTNTATNTHTPTNTPTWTPTNTPQPPDVPTHTPTNTLLPTETSTNTATNTPQPPDAPTHTPTNTQPPADTPTNTPLPPGAPTPTPTSTLPPDATTATPTSVPGATPETSPTPTATAPATQPGPTATPPQANGDVDCSGRTNSVDAVYVLQFSAGMLADLACHEDADVSGDGRINSLDSALILQHTAGLIASF